MSAPETYGSGVVPQVGDTQRMLLVKLIIAEGGGSGGGGGAVQQVYTYAGAPEGNVLVNTTLPCYCIDTTNHIGWVKLDGVVSNTGWTVP